MLGLVRRAVPPESLIFRQGRKHSCVPAVSGAHPQDHLELHDSQISVSRAAPSVGDTQPEEPPQESLRSVPPPCIQNPPGVDVRKSRKDVQSIKNYAESEDKKISLSE